MCFLLSVIHIYTIFTFYIENTFENRAQEIKERAIEEYIQIEVKKIPYKQEKI